MLFRSTCTRYLYQVPVPGTCTRYLYLVPVPGTCTRYLYQVPVTLASTKYLYQYLCKVPVPAAVVANVLVPGNAIYVRSFTRYCTCTCTGTITGYCTCFYTQVYRYIPIHRYTLWPVPGSRHMYIKQGCYVITWKQVHVTYIKMIYT